MRWQCVSHDDVQPGVDEHAYVYDEYDVYDVYDVYDEYDVYDVYDDDVKPDGDEYAYVKHDDVQPMQHSNEVLGG